MGQIKNIKLHIVTDIKLTANQYIDAYIMPSSSAWWKENSTETTNIQLT